MRRLVALLAAIVALPTLAHAAALTYDANGRITGSPTIHTFQGVSPTDHIQAVLNGGLANVSREFWWTNADLSAALSNVSLVTAASGQHLVVLRIEVMLASDAAPAAGAFGYRIGCTATTLPAKSTTGASGILASHAGLSPGGGVVHGFPGGPGVCPGGEDLLISSDDDPVGDLTVNVTTILIDVP